MLHRIEAAHKRLEEKNAELATERENARVLSEKLSHLQAASVGFEGLASQNREILDKLEDQTTQRLENDHLLETRAQER